MKRFLTIFIMLAGVCLAGDNELVIPVTVRAQAELEQSSSDPKYSTLEERIEKTEVVIAARDEKSPVAGNAPEDEDAGKSIESGQSNSFWQSLIGGKPALNARLRYEHAEMSGKEDSDAYTLRTRLGYSTRPYKGFLALVEVEYMTALGLGNSYNQAGINSSASNKTVIADVEGYELNRAYLAYQGHDTLIRVGRQRIILDDARFVGNVGWRQNEQTYDAATLGNNSIPDLRMYYAYISKVNRIFGNENGTKPAGAKSNAAKFDSNSHLVNVSYGFSPLLAVILYGYFIDLGDGAVGAANSSDTLGLNFKGAFSATETIKLSYDLAYANQFDNSATTAGTDYSANYYKVDANAGLRGYGLGGGYEVLGSDDGVSFKTPLATLHKFNGWADVFLVTPGAGLRDAYAYVTAKIPGDVTIKLVYHSFSSDEGNIDYGSEVDAVAAKNIGKYLKMIAKYANYTGDDDPANPKASNVERFSVEMNFVF